MPLVDSPRNVSRTATALDASNGEVLSDFTVESKPDGYRELLNWLEEMHVDLVAIENVSAWAAD